MEAYTEVSFSKLCVEVRAAQERAGQTQLMFKHT